MIWRWIETREPPKAMSSTETKPPGIDAEPPNSEPKDTLFCLYASDTLRLDKDATTLPLRMAYAGTAIGNNAKNIPTSKLLKFDEDDGVYYFRLGCPPSNLFFETHDIIW